MVSLLTDLVKTYVEKLINGAIAETRYVCCFTCIAEEFEDKKRWLEAEMNDVKEDAEVARRGGKNIRGKARHWEKEANELIQEDTKTIKQCFFGFCPDCIWRYKRGKELTNKLKEMEQLVEKREKLGTIELPSHLPGIESYSSQDYISLKSRELKYKELLEALKDENKFITGLHGMGGTGKTTLAKEVGKELRQSEEFSHVIITTVSYTPNMKKIQDDIAGPLGLEFGDCNESDRSKMLWIRLTDGEKNLVILDDVWDWNPPLDFYSIGIPKKDNCKGCRVLVTTRNNRVLNKMGCDKVIKLELLSNEDAWILFKRYSGISNSSVKRLIDKGRKIADECKGLPVAISVVASSLNGQKSPAEWDAALKSLKNPLSSIQGIEDESLIEVYNCLKFSYDYLKDEKAKGLFLLCSVFPEDEEIPLEILTRLGVGAGLFGEDYGSYNDARNQAVVAKNKLLDSFLLLEADEESVKMHDLVRDAAQLIANQDIRTVDMSRKDPKSLVDKEKNTKYLLLEGKIGEMFSSSFGGSKLEILICIFNRDGDGDCVEVPSSFFENMTRLRALVIYVAGQPLSLPQSFRVLTNIRSLVVYNADLGDISVLGNMQCLETLDLVRCQIDELPHEITELEKFKLLRLHHCEIRRNNPFDVIGKCSFLEELYFEDSFNNFCREINFPTALQRYVVLREPSENEWDKSLSKCVVLSCDEDEDVDDILSEATLKYIMQTTEIIKLHRIGWRWRNLIPELVPADQGMNDIFDLYLSNISKLQYLIKVDVGSLLNVFSKLVVLHLDGMEKLEELSNGPLSPDSLKDLEQLSITYCENLRSLFKFNLDLSSLKKMTLKDCPLLVSLFQPSTAQSLLMLEELEIDNCEKLESIIAYEKRGEESKEEIQADDGDNDNKKCSSILLSKLKALGIGGCPRLEFILPFVYGDLPVLETISINGCKELKYIFDQFVKLGSLKELWLNGLPNFIDIFPDCGHPVPLFVKRSCSTSRDDFKEPTQSDSIKWNVFSWTHKCWYGLKYRHKLRRSPTSTKTPLVLKDQPQHCPVASIWDRAQCFSRQSQIIMCNITDIELSGVSKIKSVFILSITPTMLVETLKIESCDELKHIIVDIEDDSGGNNLGNVFPRLKELNVWNCRQLEYIFGHYADADADADDHQSHNEIHLHLPELKSLQLWNLPSLVAMCPKQYHTTFPPLVKLELNNCIQVASKSIGDFISHASSTTSLDSTTMKELSGDVEHFLALKELKVDNSKVENIFFLNEINGQQLNLKLQEIELQNLPVMTNIFVSPKSSVTLQNLTRIKIERCEKLEIIFSTSIVRYLPQLNNLIIEECKELKYIIEDDVEDEIVLPCFPKLYNVEIINCNKLKYVFPVSICKELHGLMHLTIKEAIELQEIFRSKDGQKVEIPNLKKIELVNLPSLCQTQEIQFQNVQYRHVENCFQKPSLTSASTSGILPEISDVNFGNGNPSAEPIKDFAAGIEVQAATGHEWTSKLDLLNEESTGQQCLMNQQHLLGETDTTVKHSQGNNCLKEIKEQGIQEASASGKDISTVSKPPTQLVSPESKQESFKTSVEEGTTLDNDEIVTSTHLESINSSSKPLDTSEHKTSSQEVGYGKLSIPSLSTSQTNERKVKDENQSAETVKDFAVGVEVQAALGHELTSSQELLNEPSSSQQCLMNQQHPHGETDTTLKSSQGNNALEEKKDQSVPEASTSEKDITTLAANLETRNKPPTQLVLPESIQESFKTSVEEGTIFDNVKAEETSSTHLESITSSSGPLVTFEHKTFSKEDGDEKTSIPSLASHYLSTPNEGNPSQIVESLSSSSIITWELQQLVSKKHVASENLSLLTDFLVKHPSVRLMDNSLSNRYKGYAYNCLAELLKFLQTHSVLNVLESSRSEFLELLQDARRFAFDRGWLDGVERRALFPDLQVSQDVLEKTIHFKQQVSQHVEELKHQLASSEAVLESIIQQEAQVLESRAALSAPLGY